MQFNNPVLQQEQAAQHRLKYEGEVHDFVLNHTSVGAGSNYPLPVPAGVNRVEILCKITGGAAGTLQVWRQVSKNTDPSGFPMRVIAQTLAYNANGTRVTFEIPPNVGRLYAEHTGLPAGAQLSVVATFWREG
jgi:hypothetical protein